MIRRALLLTALVACETPPPKTPMAPAASSPLRAPGLAYELSRALSTTVGARLAGSQGDKNAIAWALDALKGRGFEPQAEPVRVRTWRRVTEKAELLAPTKKPLAVTALGWSPPTPAEGTEGEVVEIASLADAQKLAPGALSGKIAFYNVPTERTRDGSGYGRAAAVRHMGARAVERAGAIATMMRSIGTDTADNTPHTGAMRADSAGIPAVALGHQDADALHAAVATGKPARVRLLVDTEDLGTADSANVVADLPGTDRSDEIVLLGAHLDSWDLGQGALDDGAGVGAIIAALTELRAVSHSRTIRVVLFAAEENALGGGRAYARAHERELDKHVLVMEIDGGTESAYEARLFCDRRETEAHGRELAALLAPLGAAWSEQDARGGADISFLRTAGIPVLDLEQDMSRYFDIHHTSKDTVDKLDAAALDRLVVQLATVAEYAANTRRSFGRNPASSAPR